MQINQIVPIYSRQVNFKGIVPRYKTRDGYSIIPIAKDPDMADIKGAIEAAKKKKADSGLNGDAYFWGQDLVVKKYKPEGSAINYDPLREINVLDKLYDDKINLDGSQKGMYAFITPENESYLVSSRVQGETPLGSKNNLNKENLGAIVEAISKLDTGAITTENGLKNNRIMHYDLSPDNIKVTETGAGILDFEYMSYLDMDTPVTTDLYERAQWMPPRMHYADMGLMDANIRTFEHRALYEYLQETNNPKDTFSDYLMEKSKYYTTLSQFHNECAKAGDEYQKSGYSSLAEQECLHSKMLELASKSEDYKDIKKAEAMKIQLARFFYDFYSSGCEDVNPWEFYEYIDTAGCHFDFMKNEAMHQKDWDRFFYYKDCEMLLDCWRKEEPILKDCMKEIKNSGHTPANRITTLDKIVC